MNKRTLRIELFVDSEPPITMGEVNIVRDWGTHMQFQCTLLVNGTKLVRRSFNATLNDRDFDDDKHLADKILEQLGQRYGLPDIWDAKPRIDPDAGWIEEIELSEEAEQWFAFLAKYKPRLLEAFGFQDRYAIPK